jgi:hypothetical protein
MEHGRSAVDKVEIWTLLNNESEPVHPRSSQTGWLITVVALLHVWRKVSEERKLKYLEPRNANQGTLENTRGAILLHCGSNDTRLLDSL